MTIRLSEVSVFYGTRFALLDISFESSAKSIAVIGANGSGKSTFVRLLNGLAKPNVGEVEVFGKAPNTKTASFIFSNPDLQIVMPTVAEDVAFSLRGEELKANEVEQRVASALVEVGLEDLADRGCQSLSSGQKQLLAIAGVLVRNPKLVIADEPTTLLDLPNTKRITKLLHSLHCQQLVVVTHDLELAATCDEVVWFHKGEIKQIGTPENVIKRYREFCE